MDECKQKQISGCVNCQFHIYGECRREIMIENAKCGFDEKEACTRKCIYFDTCTRNPNKKRKNNEKSLY